MRRHQAPVAFGIRAPDIHLGQDRLLSELWGEDGLSQSELIEPLGVKLPTRVFHTDAGGISNSRDRGAARCRAQHAEGAPRHERRALGGERHHQR